MQGLWSRVFDKRVEHSDRESTCRFGRRRNQAKDIKRISERKVIQMVVEDTMRMYRNAIKTMLRPELSKKFLSKYGDNEEMLKLVLWKYNNQYDRDKEKINEFVERLLKKDIKKMIDDFNEAIRLEEEKIERLRKLIFIVLREVR